MPHLDRRELAAIFLGGALGSLLRVWVAHRLDAQVATWPWATFIVNATGCFVLASIATGVQELEPESPHWHPMLGTGFCGAYTTFSTMQLELVGMIDHNRYGLALSYALASVLTGYLAIATGSALVRSLSGRHL
ncbi:MAG TPA: fluoride efflux transporter CrcB [Solirubrobacteraceae bacterium]|nr:fluoride efflux transporter CrcB [Solirubrobacteraceae bacterium]